MLDPEHHLRLAIARYSIDAVLEGLAIFNVKRRMGTLPVGVDVRYLHRGLDRSFWLDAAAAKLGALVVTEIPGLALVVARRIHATHRVPRREREEAARVVLGKVTPLG